MQIPRLQCPQCARQHFYDSYFAVRGCTCPACHASLAPVRFRGYRLLRFGAQSAVVLSALLTQRKPDLMLFIIVVGSASYLLAIRICNEVYTSRLALKEPRPFSRMYLSDILRVMFLFGFVLFVCAQSVDRFQHVSRTAIVAIGWGVYGVCELWRYFKHNDQAS